jgi:hypothetical protein
MNTPSFRPFLDQAIAEQPRVWDQNTYESCWRILDRAIALGDAASGGAVWAFIGKTSAESGYTPAGFQPLSVRVARPDGQTETVQITQVGHDGVWHVPTLRQLKVIVNSAANSDTRPEIHGPAQRGGEVPNNLIDPANYRYQNPPIPWATVHGQNPTPVPIQPPGVPPFPPRDAVVDFVVDDLSPFYQSRGRAIEFRLPWRGLERLVYVDFEGVLVWVPEYLRRCQLGESSTEAAQHVLADVAAAWR